MSSSPTLHSRLRVLVAKAFRASQLYSSMRTGVKTPQNLGELANDVRARVWHQSHSELQLALNDVLALGSSSEIVSKIIQLRLRFDKRALDAQKLLERGTDRLVESANRHEFVTSLKASMDLVKFKAEMQATRVIADELGDILGGRGKGKEAEPEDSHVDDLVKDVQAPSLPSNVIPLRRRASGGRRS